MKSGPDRDADEVGNPYAAPGSESEPEEKVSLAGYRNQGRLAQVVELILGLQAVSAGFNALACIGLVLLGVDAETEEQLVSATTVAARLNQVAYLVGLIPFAMFLVRSNKNARVFVHAAAENDFHARRQPVQAFSPASMVWWFAVPFLSLVKPYQAVQAVWFNSAPERAGIEWPGRGSVLWAWWATWISSLVFSPITALLMRNADPNTHNVLVALDAAFSVAAALSAAWMILALERRQAQRATELSHDDAATALPVASKA